MSPRWTKSPRFKAWTCVSSLSVPFHLPSHPAFIVHFTMIPPLHPQLVYRSICPAPCDRKRVEVEGLKKTNGEAEPGADTLYAAPRRPAAPRFETVPHCPKLPHPRHPTPPPPLPFPRPARPDDLVLQLPGLVSVHGVHGSEIWRCARHHHPERAKRVEWTTNLRRNDLNCIQ